MTRQTPIEIALPGLPPYRLLHVPGGEFLMGSPDDTPNALDSEKPAHRVRVADFFIGEFQVTQDLWEAVTGQAPSGFKGPRRPVEQISWADVQNVFLPRLFELTGQRLRLPTEAEWEYAVRGGPFWENNQYRFAGSNLLKRVGWYNKNSNNETHDVGLLLPNTLGLYDMSGNVWEWCADCWHGSYHGAPEDGKTWNAENETRAVLRGGSWGLDSRYCRVAQRLFFNRFGWEIYFGVRLARSLS